MKLCLGSSFADMRCLFRFQDPDFSIPDPRSKRSRISDPHQRIQVFLTQMFRKSRKDPEFSSRSGFFPHPGSRIRIQGVKKAPDPGSGSATLLGSSSIFIFVFILHTWNLRSFESERVQDKRNNWFFVANRNNEEQYWICGNVWCETDDLLYISCYLDIYMSTDHYGYYLINNKQQDLAGVTERT